MKIGIITIYDAYNYGGYLQAYAMKNTLEELGHSVDMLNCSKKNILQKLKHRYPPARSFGKFVYKQKLAKTYRRAWKKLGVVRYNPQNNYDVLIVGSDEVWNLKGHFEHWQEYLGMNCGEAKVIAYAPSIGYCSPDELKANSEFVSGIKSFYRIFARDAVTQALCADITGKNVERVVDPTILFKDSWKRHMEPYKSSEDYLVYYSYKDNTPMKPHIKKFAKEHNLKIVVAGFYYTWGDEVVHPSPLEYLSLVQNAKYIVTSTFHGSMFSILLHKKLVVRPSGQKVIDLLHMAGLENHIFRDDFSYQQFEEILESDINYDIIDTIFEEKKQDSLHLLTEALEAAEGRIAK